MHAIDARTGRDLWVSDIADSPAFQLATPSTVVVSRAGLLRGVDATSGATRWTHQTSGEFSAYSARSRPDSSSPTG